MQSQSSPSNSSIKEFLRLTVFTLLCFLALTYNLSEVPPYHTDENFYVTSTRNMVASGDYITPFTMKKNDSLNQSYFTGWLQFRTKFLVLIYSRHD